MPTYRVKEGYRHGAGGKYGPGDLVQLTEVEAAGFLDKLELYSGEGLTGDSSVGGQASHGLAPEAERPTMQAWPVDWSNLLIAPLEKAGYGPGDLAEATDADLLAISGIGEGSLRKIRDRYPKS